MRHHRLASPVLAVSVFCVAAASLSAQPAEPPPRPFLRKVIQLDDQKLAAIDKGEVVTKQLPTTDKPEIAAFGVVKTAGTPDLLLRLAKDVRRFRQVPQIPEMGLFSNPPTLDDLKGLHHPPDDINALKRCKPGSCDVKLGTAALELMAKVDWKAPDAEARATTIFKPDDRGLRRCLREGRHRRHGHDHGQEGAEDPHGGVPDAARPLPVPRGLRQGVPRLPAGLPQGQAGRHRGHPVLDQGRVRPQAGRLGVSPDSPSGGRRRPDRQQAPGLDATSSTRRSRSRPAFRPPTARGSTS